MNLDLLRKKYLRNILKYKEDLYNLISKSSKKSFYFAIHNGGVPSTEVFCSQFIINYEILIFKKLKIPFNTEARFGVITTDGAVCLTKIYLIS